MATADVQLQGLALICPPTVVTNLRHGNTLVHILGEHAADNIAKVLGEVVRESNLAFADFIQQTTNVVVVEGEVSRAESEKENSQAPNVGLRSIVLLSSNDLWCCIMRGAARCLQ
jgi:hypothetical protein